MTKLQELKDQIEEFKADKIRLMLDVKALKDATKMHTQLLEERSKRCDALEEKAGSYKGQIRELKVKLDQSIDKNQLLTKQLYRAKGYIDRVLEQELPSDATQTLVAGELSQTLPARKGPVYEESTGHRAY